MKNRFPYLIIFLLITALIITGCADINQPDKRPEGQEQQPAASPEPSPEPTPSPGTDQEGENTETQEPEESEATPAPEETAEAAAELKALLPERKGYKWVYNGFAEYGHEIILEEIKEEDGKVIYVTDGEVFDMSDGESDRDFSLSVQFTVDSESLIQEKTGEMMMDLFDKIELIQAPLKEGHSLTQTVKGQDGEETTLKCTIEKIEEDDGKKVYTVFYEEEDGPYYEKRVIKEGIGVIGFTRLYITEEEYENYEMSYWLYEEASGYDK
jgi:hypothetical protein